MTLLQQSFNEIKSQIMDTMKMDTDINNSIKSKLDVYQNYIKNMKDLFAILEDDLKSYSSENKAEILENIRQNHLSTLTTAENCVNRMRSIIVAEKEIKKITKSSSFSDRIVGNESGESHSLPTASTIDLLLAERPINPVDSAKLSIHKFVTVTNLLLKGDRLSVTERASMQLRISRKIEESLSIARKHEDELCRLNTNSLEQLYKKIDDDINKYPFLKINSEFPTLYKNCQLFYLHILKDSRTYSLVQTSNAPEASCLKFILKMNNVHPIVEFLNRHVESIFSIKIVMENQSLFLDTIKAFNSTIENLSKLCCLILNTNLSGKIRNIYPNLQNVLIDFIYKNPRLSSFIYNFFFVLYERELKQYNENVKFIEDNYDHNILLPGKFKVQLDVIGIIDKQIAEFSSLRYIYNPLEKIDKLCQIVTDLMSKIQNQNSALEIGADELVPILTYMIMRFNSAEIFLHGKYLEHLMPDTYLSGIEGYLLVSIICAITFCVSENFSLHISKS